MSKPNTPNTQPIGGDGLRTQLAELLVKHDMPTRQAFLNDVMGLIGPKPISDGWLREQMNQMFPYNNPVTTAQPGDAELRKRIISILGLEKNLANQLIPSHFEDFQSDWTVTVEELLDAFATNRNTLLTEIEAAGLDAIGEDEPEEETGRV